MSRNYALLCQVGGAGVSSLCQLDPDTVCFSYPGYFEHLELAEPQVPGGRASPSWPRALNYVNDMDLRCLPALRLWGPSVVVTWPPPVNMPSTKSHEGGN